MKKALLILSMCFMVPQAYASEILCTSFWDGKTTVDAVGTQEQLSTDSVAVKYITITALANNTGAIVIGGADVNASPLASRRGVHLSKDDAITIPIDNPTKVWIDVEVAGEGATWVACR